ncbi:uncharacterized protein PG998_002804 [Apiospora kogelbergensis]|uniref:uncharacterized protein n=1 Tax=Apiospora kogelbergensis TaxID=1337665 RepID=UPI003131FE46
MIPYRVQKSEDDLLPGGEERASSVNSDTQALISEEQVLRSYTTPPRLGRGCHRSSWVVVLPWIVAVVSIGTAAYLGYQLRTQQAPDSIELPYSPPMHLVRYEHREFSQGLGDNLTKYEAPPSPSLDADWNDLFLMGIVAISREEASQLPEKTQMLPHDPENRYVVSFSVFHDLHCLNMIRKQLFPDYYTQFKIENRTEKDVEHMMHCVDALRQSTLCHADLATIPFQVVHDEECLRAEGGGQRTCVQELRRDPRLGARPRGLGTVGSNAPGGKRPARLGYLGPSGRAALQDCAGV